MSRFYYACKDVGFDCSYHIDEPTHKDLWKSNNDNINGIPKEVIKNVHLDEITEKKHQILT